MSLDGSVEKEVKDMSLTDDDEENCKIFPSVIPSGEFVIDEKTLTVNDLIPHNVYSIEQLASIDLSTFGRWIASKTNNSDRTKYIYLLNGKIVYTKHGGFVRVSNDHVGGKPVIFETSWFDVLASDEGNFMIHSSSAPKNYIPVSKCEGDL